MFLQVISEFKDASFLCKNKNLISTFFSIISVNIQKQNIYQLDGVDVIHEDESNFTFSFQLYSSHARLKKIFGIPVCFKSL